jgi:hypothetical protein
MGFLLLVSKLVVALRAASVRASSLCHGEGPSRRHLSSTTQAPAGSASIATPEGLLIAGLLCVPPHPGTTRGSNIRPHVPLLPPDGLLQFLQESKTPRSHPFRHSSLCARKITTHFSYILLAIPVSLHQFISERSTASTQRLDLPG